jgi:radical SAM protein with 4Fe4S-binding SPASM domain
MPAPLHKHCGAGSSGIAVDPYGNVYPCVQWRRPVGNLHRQGIGEIWRSSKGLEEVRDLTVRVKETIDAQGEGGYLLNFCPGTAAVHTGSPFEIYGAAAQRRELLEQVIREEAKRPLLPVLD